MYHTSSQKNLVINPTPSDEKYPKWGEIYVHAIEGAFCQNDDKHTSRAVAAIEYLENTAILEENDIILLPVQSDKAWRQHLWNNKFSLPATSETGNQHERALAVATPIAQNYPDRQVVVMFYDDAAPDALYARIAAQNSVFSSLLVVQGKVECSTQNRDEALALFERKYAFPTVEKCAGLTASLKNTDINVVDLTKETWNDMGMTYVSPEGNLNFPVASALECRTQHHIDEERHRTAQNDIVRQEAVQRGHGPVYAPISA